MNKAAYAAAYEVYSRAPGIRIISITLLVFPFLFKVTKTILALQDK
jgi:hypothetical protein